MITTTSIIVRAQASGFHCYENAPDEVAFLREVHRHVFHVEAELEVYHDDRELEFFLVQRELKRLLEEALGSLPLHARSCERIARTIQQRLFRLYSTQGKETRAVAVYVSEDNENGARVVGQLREEGSHDYV